MLSKSISETYNKSPKDIYLKFEENFLGLSNNNIIAEFNYSEFKFYEEDKKNH